MSRLPEVGGEAENRGSGSGDRLLFAAGAVSFQPPKGWWTWQVPQGRELFLAIAPQDAPGGQQLPRDGFWMAYHVTSGAAGANPYVELNQLMENRVFFASDGWSLTAPPRQSAVTYWPALVQELRIGPPEVDRSNAAHRIGRHVLVRTNWGIFELHAESPVAVWAPRSGQFDTMIADLKLELPQPLGASTPIADTVQDAAPVLGTWRSARGRLRLLGNGLIQVLPDHPAGSVEGIGASSVPCLPTMLNGRFAAQSDLLSVVWHDDSRQRFLWRLQGEDLLLRGDDGQLTLLKRLLE